MPYAPMFTVCMNHFSILPSIVTIMLYDYKGIVIHSFNTYSLYSTYFVYITYIKTGFMDDGHMHNIIEVCCIQWNLRIKDTLGHFSCPL